MSDTDRHFRAMVRKANSEYKVPERGVTIWVWPPVICSQNLGAEHFCELQFAPVTKP